VSRPDYCTTCHKMILYPDQNYGINPDAVCKCAAPTGERTRGDVTDLLREGQQRMRDMIAECEERGEKDRPFLIGCLQWIGLAEAALRAPSQPTSPAPQLRGEPDLFCSMCGKQHLVGTPCAASQPSATAREVAWELWAIYVENDDESTDTLIPKAVALLESYSARAVAAARVEAYENAAIRAETCAKLDSYMNGTAIARDIREWAELAEREREGRK
jgi:hypothetical protein